MSEKIGFKLVEVNVKAPIVMNQVLLHIIINT